MLFLKYVVLFFFHNLGNTYDKVKLNQILSKDWRFQASNNIH